MKQTKSELNTTLTGSSTVALSVMGRSYFNLWLKSQHYSVVRVNTIPTAGSALGVISALATGIYADKTGRRKETLIGILVVVIIANILLTVWHLRKGALFFAYFLAYVGAAASPIVIVSILCWLLGFWDVLLIVLYSLGVKRWFSMMLRSDNCLWRLRMYFRTPSVHLYQVREVQKTTYKSSADNEP